MISCPSSNEDLVLRDGQGFQHSRRSIFFLSFCVNGSMRVFITGRERERWAGQAVQVTTIDCVCTVSSMRSFYFGKRKEFFQTPKVVFWPWWRPPLSFIYRSPWRRSAHTLDTKRARLPLLLSPFFFLYSFLDSVSLSLFCCQRDRGQKGRRRQDGAAMQMTPSSLYLIPRPHFS